MNKLSYLFKRLFSMNYIKMIATAKRISKSEHKSSCIIFLDMIYCGFKYLAGYVDYEVFGFAHLTKAQRETVITRGVNNKYVALLNDKEYVKYLDNKLLFNKQFNKYLKRAWLSLEDCSFEDFKNFMKKYKTVIAKPIDLACGKDVIKLRYDENIDLNELYNSLISNNQLLLEELIVQHDELAKLYPLAVNTLRIVTITKNNNTHIMFKSIRMGNAGNIVDNFNHGGLFATIENDGTITSPAVDKKGNVYNFHPYTNTNIIGFKIPYFYEAINLVKDLASQIPEVGYVGWDIAITPNGPVVVEANPFPGHDIYQSKVKMDENSIGMKKHFDQIVYS